MEPLLFLSEYDAELKPLICFKWNEKHGDGFEDANQEFRRYIMNYIFENDQLYISKELVSDLFLAESLWAKEAWCVYQKYHLIGEKLLRSGGIQYIDDFLEGAFSSFDTYCSCRMMNLVDYNISNLIYELKNRIKEATDPEQKKRYVNGIELFKLFIEGDPSEGIVSLTGSVKVQNIKEVRYNIFSKILNKLKR
ncbi:hypothetical protein [Bacillus sp. FJAT-28004]|uniref:hypothetical protein n=1 Tax=Bacillus sp. FJAT-28004 TaxID=1679165 RepID=UPI0006B4D22A|nr:hypothetical protein [Bacillus sp. FJAT-28004]